jgi:penicillin-binding protein 1A
MGVLAGFASAHLIHIPRVSELSDYRPDIITEIRADDGSTIARYAVERRILLSRAQISNMVRNAIVASEDKNFYRHGGLDLMRSFSAAVRDLLTKRYAQGASTLTQQLARAIFLTPRKTLARKINEAFLAFQIEKEYSKDQILTMYCNQVYLGHGNYGIEAASRYYFGKPVGRDTLGEAALLAGLIQRPEDISPFRNPAAARARRHYVLRRMLEDGYIRRAAYEAADKEPLPSAPSQPETIVGPYFCEEIRQYLEKTYGEKDLYQRGLHVDSTLDPRLQHDAEIALRRGLRRIERRHGFQRPRNLLAEGFQNLAEYRDPSWDLGPPDPEDVVRAVVTHVDRRSAELRAGSETITLTKAGIAWTGARAPNRLLRVGDLVSVDREPDPQAKPVWTLEPEPRFQGAALILENSSGAVRAMVGGYDWNESKFNRAVQAERQTGSSFKPFVYLTALENGFTPSDTLFDAPISIIIDPRQPPYEPTNYTHDYAGIVTLDKALENSINVPAVRLAQLVGLGNVIDTARRLGITQELRAYPSLALGAFETTLWDMTSAYSVFSNQGLQFTPYLVSRVIDADGSVLEQNRPEAHEVANPQACFELLWMLKGVCQRGTAASASSLGLNVAGKTGTTNDYTDAWFIGMTPKYTIGVWVGNDKKTISLGRNMTGAAAALPIWIEIVGAMKNQGAIDPRSDFDVPPSVTFEAVDYDTGLKATTQTPRPILEAFVTGSEPTEEWNPRWAAIVRLPWALQRPFYTPKRGESGLDARGAEPTSAPPTN